MNKQTYTVHLLSNNQVIFGTLEITASDEWKACALAWECIITGNIPADDFILEETLG